MLFTAGHNGTTWSKKGHRGKNVWEPLVLSIMINDKQSPWSEVGVRHRLKFDTSEFWMVSNDVVLLLRRDSGHSALLMPA